MDERQFDRWTRALTEHLSRRGLNRMGGGVLLALGLSVRTADDLIAKPKKRPTRRNRDQKRDADKPRNGVATEKKRKKRKKPASSACTPNCAGGKTCGSNGCPGGSCGTCRNGFFCSDERTGGVCECPSGITCAETCCGETQSCVDSKCCDSDRICDEECCTEAQICQSQRCRPLPPPDPITCNECGSCQRCEADGDTAQGECGKNCRDDCFARQLCQEARSNDEAQGFANYLTELGYRQVGVLSASVLDENGVTAITTVSIRYADPFDEAEFADLVYRTGASVPAKAFVLVSSRGSLAGILGFGDENPLDQPSVDRRLGGKESDRNSGRDPKKLGRNKKVRRVNRSASLSMETALEPDESRVSAATCGVCTYGCEFFITFALTVQAASSIKSASIMFASWRRIGSWINDPHLVNWYNPDVFETFAYATLSLHDVLESTVNRPPDKPQCREGGCVYDGYCCGVGRRLCASPNPLAFSGCVDEGVCCENGTEGTCPPSIGTICTDHRSDPVHCGGCSIGGGAGTNCLNLSTSGDYVRCKQGRCEFNNCKRRGEAFDPSDGSLNGCCRRGDTEQFCRDDRADIVKMCAGTYPDGAECCVDDTCPSDPDPSDRYCGCHGNYWTYLQSYYNPASRYCGHCEGCGGSFNAYDTYFGLRRLGCYGNGGELPCQPKTRSVCPTNWNA